MFAPRALRPLARTATRAVRIAPRATRLMSSARPSSSGGQGGDEHAKVLLMTSAAMVAVVTAGNAAWEARKKNVHPSEPKEEEEAEEAEEEVAEEEGEAEEAAVEEEKGVVEAVEAKIEKAVDAAEAALAELIADAETALGMREAAPASGPDALAAEAASQGAFNEETGEINWDCPCLGGMATGPCGEEFKAAFSCFVYSEAEPKGIDCVEKFKGMQDCFREHPDVYGEEEMDEELEGEADSEPAPPALEEKK